MTCGTCTHRRETTRNHYCGRPLANDETDDAVADWLRGHDKRMNGAMAPAGAEGCPGWEVRT